MDIYYPYQPRYDRPIYPVLICAGIHHYLTEMSGPDELEQVIARGVDGLEQAVYFNAYDEEDPIRPDRSQKRQTVILWRAGEYYALELVWCDGWAEDAPAVNSCRAARTADWLKQTGRLKELGGYWLESVTELTLMYCPPMPSTGWGMTFAPESQLNAWREELSGLPESLGFVVDFDPHAATLHRLGSHVELKRFVYERLGDRLMEEIFRELDIYANGRTIAPFGSFGVQLRRGHLHIDRDGAILASVLRQTGRGFMPHIWRGEVDWQTGGLIREEFPDFGGRFERLRMARPTDEGWLVQGDQSGVILLDREGNVLRELELFSVNLRMLAVDRQNRIIAGYDDQAIEKSDSPLIVWNTRGEELFRAKGCFAEAIHLADDGSLAFTDGNDVVLLDADLTNPRRYTLNAGVIEGLVHRGDRILICPFGGDHRQGVRLWEYRLTGGRAEFCGEVVLDVPIAGDDFSLAIRGDRAAVFDGSRLHLFRLT